MRNKAVASDLWSEEQFSSHQFSFGKVILTWLKFASLHCALAASRGRLYRFHKEVRSYVKITDSHQNVLTSANSKNQDGDDLSSQNMNSGLPHRRR